MIDATADSLVSLSTPSSLAAIPAQPLAAGSEASQAADASALQPFLRTLGHELRNVMGTIAVSVEVLSTGAGGEDASDSALKILARQAARLDTVMATALALARALEGGTVLSLRAVALGDVVAQVADELAAHGQRLVQRAAPAAWVDVDPAYLAQAIRSLVAASLPRDGVEAWVGVTASHDGWVLRFTAQASDLDAPWTPSPTPASPELLRSIGLDGLLGRQLVALHHGSVHLSARHGGGFALVLPRSPAA